MGDPAHVTAARLCVSIPTPQWALMHPSARGGRGPGSLHDARLTLRKNRGTATRRTPSTQDIICAGERAIPSFHESDFGSGEKLQVWGVGRMQRTGGQGRARHGACRAQARRRATGVFHKLSICGGTGLRSAAEAAAHPLAAAAQHCSEASCAWLRMATVLRTAMSGFKGSTLHARPGLRSAHATSTSGCVRLCIYRAHNHQSQGRKAAPQTTAGRGAVLLVQQQVRASSCSRRRTWSLGWIGLSHQQRGWRRCHPRQGDVRA